MMQARCLRSRMKRALASSFVCFCILVWMCALPCALAQDTEVNPADEDGVSPEESVESGANETPDTTMEHQAPEGDLGGTDADRPPEEGQPEAPDDAGRMPAPPEEETQYDVREQWRAVRVFEPEPEPFVRQGTPGGDRVKVPAADIMNAIAEGVDIDVERAIIDGDLDIGLIASKLEVDENRKMIIKGNIGIRFSEITGDTTLSSTHFTQKVSFTSVTFVGSAGFDGATFGDYADFSSATFNSEANFRDAVFKGNVDFISPTFKSDAFFELVTFNGYAYFRSSIFGKAVDFTDATFGGAAVFIDSTFVEQAKFLRTSMSSPASFEGAKYRENTVLAGLWNDVLCSLVSFVTINKLNLPRKTVTDFIQFDTGSVMDGSSNPYLRRYIDDEQWIKSWRGSIWWRQPLFMLWEITSHCGRSIGLWGLWSGIIAFGFAIIYTWFLPTSITFSMEKLSDVRPGFKGYLYYSVVTLTTLGYGDIVPLTNRARFIVGTEVVSGYIMLGGLVSIFANKIATRS